MSAGCHLLTANYQLRWKHVKIESKAWKSISFQKLLLPSSVSLFIASAGLSTRPIIENDWNQSILIAQIPIDSALIYSWIGLLFIVLISELEIQSTSFLNSQHSKDSSRAQCQFSQSTLNKCESTSAMDWFTESSRTFPPPSPLFPSDWKPPTRFQQQSETNRTFNRPSIAAGGCIQLMPHLNEPWQ